MSSRINKIYATEKVENSSKTKKKTSKVEVFSSKPQNTTHNPADWDIAHYQTIKKWSVKPYKWTSIVDTNDAIEKSQQTLIDMLRYYEGDPKKNYKAKEKYKDLNGKGTTTFGYGITQLPKKFGKLAPPKNEKEAYNMLMLYLDKVSYDEAKKMFRAQWKDYPESLKEALIDFNFNKGNPIVGTRKNAIINAYKNNDWATLLKNLVYIYPGASNAEKVEDAGLHRRSLSRAILAVRDIERTSEIDATIYEIYKTGRDCAEAQGEDLAEFDKIYNAYINKGKIVETPVQTEKNVKVYNINEKISVYSLALSLRPLGQKSDCLKIIIDEIIKLNNIKVEEHDSNGFPKCRSIENEAIKLPKSIKLNGQIVHLNTPTKYKETVETTVVVPDTTTIAKTDTVDNKTVTNDSTKVVTTGNTTSKKEKSIGFFEFTKTLVQLSLIKIGQGIKEIFSGDDKSESKEDTVVDDFDYSKPPFERLLNSKNTTIEQDGEFQIITTEYKVKKGDGVWRLAQTYNLDETNFCEINGIEDRNKIQKDQILKIQKLGYKVKNGDNLTTIAKKFGIDIGTLKDLNNIDDENIISENQLLELPGFIHTVKSGENLTSIAKKVGMPVKTLMKINGLESDKINPGDRIKLVYDETDFAIPESNRTVKVDTATNTTIETINMGKAHGLATRPLLQNKDKINGKVVATRKVFEPTKQGKLSGKTIIVNAGHGYQESGGVDGGTPGLKGLDDEYLLNYDNAMRLKDELCAKGAKVIFLQGKRNLILNELPQKRNKADLFISVHVNSGGTNPSDRTEFHLRTEDVKTKNKASKFADVAEKNFDTWISKNEKIKKKDRFILNKKQDYAQIKHDSRWKIGKNNKKIKNKEYRLALLDGVLNSQSNIPYLIWEVAFMNSSKGRERLANDNLMDNYAKVMANSIEETLT